MQKKIDWNELIFVTVLLVVSGVAFLMALQYSNRGKAFPLIVLVCLMAMLSLKLLGIFNPKVAARIEIHGIDLPNQEPTPDKPSITAEPKKLGDSDTAKWQRELMMIFWLAFLLALIFMLGLLYTVPIFLFLFLKLQGKQSWFVSATCSFVLFALVYGLFGVVLSLEFPQGVLLL